MATAEDAAHWSTPAQLRALIEGAKKLGFWDDVEFFTKQLKKMENK